MPKQNVHMTIIFCPERRMLKSNKAFFFLILGSTRKCTIKNNVLSQKPYAKIELTLFFLILSAKTKGTNDHKIFSQKSYTKLELCLFSLVLNATTKSTNYHNIFSQRNLAQNSNNPFFSHTKC